MIFSNRERLPICATPFFRRGKHGFAGAGYRFLVGAAAAHCVAQVNRRDRHHVPVTPHQPILKLAALRLVSPAKSMEPFPPSDSMSPPAPSLVNSLNAAEDV